MEVVVILSVLVMITNIEVEARSVDSEIEESNTKDGDDREERPKEIIFKLPTAIEEGFTLTISGTLQLNQSTFTAELPNLNGIETEHCRLTYNVTGDRSLIIAVSPSIKDGGIQTDSYELGYSNESMPELVEFTLAVRADILTNRFILTFNANGAGEKTLTCGVNNFDDIEHIVLKDGVHKIKSLLFEFE